MDKKIKIKEVIVVEGKYDKITLSNIVDSLIIQTDGFRIFKDNDLKSMIRTLAERQGLLVLTDSDGAGLVIRNHLAGIVPKSQIKHAYIPEIFGKEKRKAKPSMAGTMGVEGMSRETLVKALIRAGATLVEGDRAEVCGEGNQAAKVIGEKITMSDLVEVGAAGLSSSSKVRDTILNSLGLPAKMTAKRMLDVVNTIMSRAEFFAFCHEILNS